MAITVASSSNSGWSLATPTVNVAKPSGLAVGDLMIGFTVFIKTMNLSSFPSGFTQLGEVVPATATDLHGYLIYKYATASDVAASNFTFTFSNTFDTFCAILRITDATVTISNLVHSEELRQNQVSPSMTGVTPAVNVRNLIIQAWFPQASGTITGVSGYSIVNSNPSWTEIFDANDAGNYGAACAYGVRSGNSATGNASCTVGGGTTSTDSIGFIIAIPMESTVTLSDSLTTSDSISKVIGVNPFDSIETSDEFSGSKSRLWTNKTKPNTTWTNKQK